MTTTLALRRKYGLSQNALATMAGVYQSTVCRWELGRGEPTLSQCQRIINAAGGTIKPHDFLTPAALPGGTTPAGSGKRRAAGGLSSEEAE